VIGGKIFILVSLLSLFACKVEAQGTLEALVPATLIGPVYSQYPVGYVNDGIGWIFTPTQDLIVTAISSTAPQVSIWQGTSQVLGSYQYLGSDFSFQSISPLLLTAGQSYAISTENSNPSGVGFSVGSPSGASGVGIISISSYLTGYASFEISTRAC